MSELTVVTLTADEVAELAEALHEALSRLCDMQWRYVERGREQAAARCEVRIQLCRAVLHQLSEARAAGR